MTPSILFVSILFLGLSLLVSGILKRKFSAYGEIGLASGLSGAEVAAMMLRHNNIYDVKMTSVEGFMTDHYNPANKTINLSPDVYNGRSIACCCGCGPRNRPRGATCHCLSMAYAQKQAGSGGAVQFGDRSVGVAGRRVHD